MIIYIIDTLSVEASVHDPKVISEEACQSMRAFAENLPHLDSTIVDAERVATSVMMVRSSDFNLDVVSVYALHLDILRDCHRNILQMHEEIHSTLSPEYKRVLNRIIEAIEHYENGKRNSRTWE